MAAETRALSIPEYQIVNIHSRTKRDTSNEEDKRIIKLNIFGKSLDLNLERNNNLMRNDVPLYSVIANSTGHLEYQLLQHEEPLGVTYQDIKNQAALVIHTDPEDGATLYEGTIGHELVVRPLPSSLRLRMMENEIENAHIEKSHVIFKRKQQDKVPHYSDYALMEPGDLVSKIRRKRSLRRKREAPYVIYPEILVIVDYDGYRLHGGDNVQIKRYFISFWNGVDLRYKLLKGPKVRISIAGIIISRCEIQRGTQYIKKIILKAIIVKSFVQEKSKEPIGMRHF
uniref:Peptidase M12B propeptide domain-containing protein n=1 Tax=Rhodnius prolixus TaxID=13249 RepID=T1HBG2_RHOPR